MPDLIPPHGGGSEPVDRTVPAAEVDAFRQKAASLKKVPVSDAHLSSLYRFGDGGLTPLIGPMDKATFDHLTGAVLNPLIGETKGDDVDAPSRMKTYQALIENKALGSGDLDQELWKKVGRDFYDNLILLGLDIKMFYGGPKEAIMHGIYRQNFGFTDIIIGRKHADAPYDDGKDIWDGLAAQRKFSELKGELLIQPVKVGFAAFYEELGRLGLVDEYASKSYKQVSISGREMREKLRGGVLPDPRIMRPEAAKILIESMRGK